MARKNLFDISGTPPAEPATEPLRKPLSRPLMGLDRPLKPTGPVGAISQSLENITSRAQRAEEIEKKIAEGQAIVELDPELIDNSIVIDRLGVEEEQQAALVEQIRDHGQQVPILVRPHPDQAGRYQVAYGHRRLAAVRQLGGPVKAMIRALTDEQLVVSQGQENNSRADLSYIERCYFAARLEARGFSRDVIIASLGVDKAALSRMISLVGSLPSDIIEAIGPAPAFGRLRWAELGEMLKERGKLAKAQKLATDEQFLARRSDERFQTLYDALKAVKEKPQVSVWATPNGSRLVRIIDTEEKATFAFDKRVEPGFVAFVRGRLGALYDEFQKKDD